MSSRHYNADPRWAGRSYKKGGARISVLRERVRAQRERAKAAVTPDVAPNEPASKPPSK